MVEYIQKLILGTMGRSVIRKLMVLLAGVLLGIGIEPGVVDQFTSSSTEIIIGVLLYIIAQGWSVVEKKLQAKLPGSLAKDAKF